MEKLSRTEKYKELRESLQNDVGQEIETKDLSSYQERLNKIAPSAFEAPKQRVNTNSHEATHARNDVIEEDDISFDNTMDMHYDLKEPSFDATPNTYSNDYLDRYIDEVKQYNIEQGNAVSEDTTVNILNRIRKAEDSLSSRPYPRNTNKSYTSKSKDEDTTDIPFMKPSSKKTTSQTNHQVQNIASQVQNLLADDEEDTDDTPIIESTQKPQQHVSSMNTNDFNKHLELERTTRQQLLNETTQMRSQLDDYEDNLSEVSAKMRHTNQMLNIVLGIMIVVLVVVIMFIIYSMFLK